MNRLLPAILLVSASWMIAACGGGSTAGIDPEPPGQGLLKQVTDPAELEQSIKSGFSAMRSPQELADAQAATAASGNFTGPTHRKRESTNSTRSDMTVPICTSHQDDIISAAILRLRRLEPVLRRNVRSEFLQPTPTTRPRAWQVRYR